MILLIYFYASTLFFKFYENINISSAQFSCSVVSDSLQSHGLQHTRLPCSSQTPRGFTNSCPLSQGCHPTISSSVVPFSSRLQTFPESVFSNESALHIRWPNYWSFSFNISPSNEYSELISFTMDWLALLSVQGTLKSLLQHHSSKASILQHSVFFIVQLSHPYICMLLLLLLLHHFSRVRLFMTPWTAAHQGPLSMRFSRQEYWSGMPCV